jgi:hypothetical protein
VLTDLGDIDFTFLTNPYSIRIVRTGRRQPTMKFPPMSALPRHPLERAGLGYREDVRPARHKGEAGGGKWSTLPRRLFAGFP